MYLVGTLCAVVLELSKEILVSSVCEVIREAFVPHILLPEHPLDGRTVPGTALRTCVGRSSSCCPAGCGSSISPPYRWVPRMPCGSLNTVYT